MNTLSYIYGQEEEIKIGEEYYFGQLWDGESGDAEQLLEDGCVSPDEENTVAFVVVEEAEDKLNTIVRVTDIY